MAYTAPNPVTDLSLTRNSDSKVTATWTNDSTYPRDYTKIYVNLQVDTAGSSQVAALGGTATNYSWLGAQPNKRYRAAVRPYNPAGYGTWTWSNYVYTTPAAPASVVAEVPSVGTVDVAVVAGATWAIYHEVEVTADGGETWTAKGTMSGVGGTYTDTAPPAGTCTYRVRAVTHGLLYSEWTLSNELVAICPPLAPTITVAPPAVVAVGSTLTLEWVPNHPDGTEQTKAEVEVTVGGVSTTISINDGTTTQDLSSYATTPQSVSVRVRTYGIYAEWGAWSNTIAFTAYDLPVVTIDAPANDNDVMTALPVTVAWTATDSTGIAQVVLRLFDGDGMQLRNWTLAGTETSFDLDRNSYFLTNNESYSVTVTVTAGSTLQATATRLFDVAYVGPPRSETDVWWDEATLACAVTVSDSQPSIADMTPYGIGTGTSVTTLGASSAPLHSLTVHGKSVQDGTPTPSTPVAIESVAAGQLIVNPEAASGWQPQGGSTVEDYIDATVGACLKFTQAGGGSSYRLQTQSSNFTHVSGTTYALGFWARASAATTIYASCGTSTNVNVNYVNGASIGTEWTYFSGDGTANGAYRLTFWAASAVTLYIWHPMLVLGSTVAKYATMGNIGIATSWYGSITPIDLQGHQLRSLPNGIKDQLTVDSAGNVTLTQRCERTTQAVTDGVTGTVGVDVLSSTGQIADGPQVVYKLATPQTISLGSITMPTLADGDTMEIVGSSVVPSIVATWPVGGADGYAEVTDGMTLAYAAATLTQGDTYTLMAELDGVTVDIDGGAWSQQLAPVTASASGTQQVACADDSAPYSAVATVAGDGRVRLSLYAAGYDGPYQPWSAATPPASDHFYVVRIAPDGSEYIVADNLASSEQALDPLPPLGVDFTYRVVAVASSGAETPVDVVTRKDTNAWAFGFGQGVAETAQLIASPSASSSWEHGGETYHFADGTDNGLPMFYGLAELDVAHSWSFVIPKKWMDVAENVQRLFRRYSTCWVRDPFGHRWHVMAKATVGVKQGPRWEVSVQGTELRFQEA